MDDLAKWRSVTLVLAGLKFELKIHDYKTIEKMSGKNVNSSTKTIEKNVNSSTKTIEKNVNSSTN